MESIIDCFQIRSVSIGRLLALLGSVEPEVIPLLVVWKYLSNAFTQQRTSTHPAAILPKVLKCIDKM
jgi:hypothetical protein